MTEFTHRAGKVSSSARPFVSIVTPFYNTAEFLETAIRSVLAQSYENFEYILADNCSTDGSAEIAHKYALQDSRIRLFRHTEFIDQDPNYNRALRYISADSEYCKIVQADDWILPNCVSEMVALAEQSPAVSVVGCCYIAGDTLAGHGLPFDRSLFSGKEACRTRLLKGGTYFGSPTCLLYRSSAVRRRDPFFRLGFVNTDTMTCFELLTDSDFGRVPQILVYLRRGNPSVSGRLEAFEVHHFANLALIVRFGPQFLSPRELEARRKTLEAQYATALARALLSFKSREYWDFHTSVLASVGRTLPVFRITLSVIDLFLDKVLNPRRTIQNLVAGLRKG